MYLLYNICMYQVIYVLFIIIIKTYYKTLAFLFSYKSFQCLHFDNLSNILNIIHISELLADRIKGKISLKSRFILKNEIKVICTQKSTNFVIVYHSKGFHVIYFFPLLPIFILAAFHHIIDKLIFSSSFRKFFCVVGRAHFE